MKRFALVAAACLIATPGFAAQPAPPEKLATCAACHGETGVSPQPAVYPNLAGQYASYLINSMQQYRSGARKNAIMAAQAASLTDEEIEALSRYFAAQKGPLFTPGLPQRQN